MLWTHCEMATGSAGNSKIGKKLWSMHLSLAKSNLVLDYWFLSKQMMQDASVSQQYDSVQLCSGSKKSCVQYSEKEAHLLKSSLAVRNLGLNDEIWICFKVNILWEGHKIIKNISYFLSKRSVLNVKTSVVFSENLNFIKFSVFLTCTYLKFIYSEKATKFCEIFT